MKNKHPFFRTLSRELDRIRQKRTIWFISIIGPLIGFLIVTCIFRSGVPHKLPFAIIDQDRTSLSRQMIRMINATPVAEVKKEYSNLADAREDLLTGNIEGLLVIPEESEKNILQGRSADVAVYLNNSNVLKGGLLNSGIRKALSTFSAGIKLQVQMKNGLTQDEAMSRIMPVQLRQVLLFNPYTSYAYYLMAGLLPIVLIVFVLLGTTYVIGDELYRGTGPQWIKSADGNFLIALSAKLLPYTTVYFLLAILMNSILFLYLGMPMQGHYHVILVSELLLILSYQLFAVLILALTSNMRLSLSLGSAYSMLALTFSGLTFPVTGMAVFSQVFSNLFPFTWWLKILIGQSLRGEQVSHAAIPLMILFIFILIGSMFIPLLRYMLINKRRWGKI